MTKTQKQKIKEIAEKMNLDYIYLFGSQARGTAGPLSDFDLAAKFNSRTKNKFKAKLNLLTELQKILKSEKVDVVDIEKADPIMRFYIVSEGKVLYSRSEEKRIMDKVKITLFYLDKKYYYTRHLKEAAQKMALGDI